MKLPATMRPNSTLDVPVKLAGLTSGEEARVVVAAVDVGILNLTNYKPPAPDDYYLGQRRLTAEIRDLYGQLIDGMQGVKGQIRSGGDSAGAELSGSPPTQAPLALYSGIVTVGRDGAAQVQFDIPAFAGSVRVMAVAWTQGQSRQGVRRCHRARPGRADGDAAALPAHRRPRRGAARARQRGRRGRRLQPRRSHRRSRQARRRSAADAQARGQAAQSLVRSRLRRRVPGRAP